MQTTTSSSLAKKIATSSDAELEQAESEIEQILAAGAGSDTFLARLEVTYTAICEELHERQYGQEG